MLGFPDKYRQSISSGYSFNNSIASGFGFPDKNCQFILVLFAFNNSIAFGFEDNFHYQHASLLYILNLLKHLYQCMVFLIPYAIPQ